MWSNIVENDGFDAVQEVLRNWSPGFRDRALPGPLDIPQMPALIDRGRARSNEFFDRVEGRLGESRYLAGDFYSFADVSLLAVTDFSDWVDLEALRNRPNLARWYAEVSARPSAGA